MRCFYSNGILRKNVIKAAHFLPAYWYIRTDELCTQYTGTSGELKTYAMYLGIQLLFAFAAFSAALVISRYKKILYYKSQKADKKPLLRISYLPFLFAFLICKFQPYRAVIADCIQVRICLCILCGIRI